MSLHDDITAHRRDLINGQLMPDGRPSCGTRLFDLPAETITRAEIRRMIRQEVEKMQADDELPDLPARPTLEACIEAAAKVFNVSKRELVGNIKHRYIAHPRHAAMLLAHILTKKSNGQIARLFNRDTSTVHKALITAKELRKRDPDFDALFAQMLAHFKKDEA